MAAFCLNNRRARTLGHELLCGRRDLLTDRRINEDFQPDDVQAREIMEICRHIDVGKIFV